MPRRRDIHLVGPVRQSARALALKLGLLLLGGLGWGLQAHAQNAEIDAALRDRVLQLVERLDAPAAEARDAAAASLIKLGPKVLPLLPDPAALKAGPRKDALEKVRAALRAKDEDVNTAASKATLSGKGIRLSEALQQIQKQTGNALSDMREQLGTEVTNPALDLDLRDKPFFEVLEEVARQASVALTFSTGDGTIGIMAAAMPAADAPNKPIAGAKPLVQFNGPFRVELQQFSLSRDYGAGTAATALARFEVAWEPRLRPMLMKLKTDEIKITDDLKAEVKPQVAMEADEVVIRPENPSAEVNLNLAAPAREAKKLASLKVKMEVTIPAGIRTFKVPSLAAKDTTIKQGDLSLTLEDTEVDEQVWKVNVTLAYPGEGPAFESYRQGLFNNRIWLQRADGSRFEHNGGFSNTGTDGGKLGFEYLFVDAPGKPGDYALLYETPSRVITIPLEFEFKDVPLP
jgi:hypothetical protein